MTETPWRRSTRCEAASCVEARRVGDTIELRDSKRDNGPILRFTLREWDAFTGGVTDGEFRFEAAA